MEKICFKCKDKKQIESFTRRSVSKDGYNSYCKKCEKIIRNEQKIRNINHNKIISIIEKKCYTCQKIKLIKNFHKKKTNRDGFKNTCIECSNKEIDLYRKNNKHKIRNYENNKYKTEISYKLRKNLKSDINNFIRKKGYKNNKRISEIIGCTLNQLKEYLESKFENWMTWDNYGKYNGQLNYGWDIDHIIPQSSTTTEEHLYKLNHYTNLQPLCSYTNRYIKSNKYDN